MKRVLAIARLTFWEGVRMRIVLVFLVLLVFIVLRLPFALRGDETLAGRLQTFLSYSLGALGIFMSLATVFLSCSTLTKDVQECSLHLVITKPVSRFQILAGKWLGVNSLNLLIVLLSGLVIYGFAVFIKSRPEQFARDRIKIDDVVWTARAAARPVKPDFREKAREYVDQLVEDGKTFPHGEAAAVRQYAKEWTDTWKRIGPRENRRYEFENLSLPSEKDTIYQVRFKAMSSVGVNDPLKIGWAILDPETNLPLATRETDERSSARHQFLVRSGVVKDGRAAIVIYNPTSNRYKSIHLEGEDGLEILYKVGGFEMNLAKNLLLVLFRLAFLSAAGLFFSTFVSFPVACFCVLTIFVLCIGMPWWQTVVGTDLQIPTPQIDPYGSFGPLARLVLKPLLTVVLPNFIEYDGTSRLIDGALIPASLLWRGGAHTLIYGVVLLALPGWLIFRSREIAQTIV